MEMNGAWNSTFLCVKCSIQSLKVLNRKKRNQIQDDPCLARHSAFEAPVYLKS